MITLKGKILLTVVVLAIAGFGTWKWSDKLFPKAKQEATSNIKDVVNKLLAGTNAVSLKESSSIPPVVGTSDYDKTSKNGKIVVNFPINVWPGWAPIIVANQGMDANDNSVFFKKYGFYVQLSIVDDPVKARDLFASGHTHVLWGTLDMMALFAPALVRDSRTIPVIAQQIDWSSGGDGIVARNGIRNINDLAMKNGIKKKVVLPQNSPSHAFIMSLLLDAGIDPSQIDFKWTADAPSAAKIFVQDNTMDAFVGWSPDIYTVSEGVPNTKLIVSTASANHLLADVWAVRNDFYRDHSDVVANLVRGIFEGMDMVRKDPTNAASLMSKAYSLPEGDCLAMIGKDGGITSGDAHLTNYRENFKFFLEPNNPSSFDVVWNRSSAIYSGLGAIDTIVVASKVKASKIISEMSEEYKDSTDLSQATFKPNAVFGKAESDSNQILTKAVIINFEPNKSEINTNYDTNIPITIEEIGKLAGSFGNAYIVIEGNTDASRKGLIPADLVRQLSYDRADSVKKYIISKYKFDNDKFKVIGNGWENPLAGMTDPSNTEANKKNRRVEVKVFSLEQ
jgi:NitT/TauT family transport system substrate-binding protein